MALSPAVQPLSITAYSFLHQEEVGLDTLALEINDEILHLAFPSGESYPLTQKGFESLCKLIQVPVGFANRLKDDGAGHVLSYLQKQLSQTYLRDSVLIVRDTSTNPNVRASAGHILAVTTKEYILPDLSKVAELDAEILKTAQAITNGELRTRLEVDGTLRYGFVVKKDKVGADSSEYEFGHVLSYSLYGLELPQIYQVAIRCEDLSTLVLPFKPAEYPVNGSNFMADLLSAVETLDSMGWTDLEGYLTRLKSVNASLREVKETRQKLLRSLKVDKDDRDTGERLEQFFGWKKLVERYEIKTLAPKPSKRWYMSASSNLNLLDLYLKLIAETTHAPNTISNETRAKLDKYASRLLAKFPDLAEKEPPKVQWA